MKVAIVNNPKTQSLAVKEKILELFLERGILLDQDQPDIVISIGGDGTLLHAFHAYQDQLDRVRFIGLHTGHLGFYTDWKDNQVAELVDAISRDQGEHVSYPLLEVRLVHSDGLSSRRLALNESAIRRYEGTMTCEVYIRDELFEVFRGDGLCVSTPTGSTGLNKSLGGAVVHPRLPTLQLTEIASLNNRVFRTLSSSMLIAPDEWIVLRPGDGEISGVYLFVDQYSAPLEEVKQIEFRIAEERIHFARYRHLHFWNRVKTSFIG